MDSNEMQGDTEYIKRKENRQIDVSPVGYRPYPIDGPSDIPKCCSQDVEPTGSTPSTVVVPFVVGLNIGN
jgi:hypothetical protein